MYIIKNVFVEGAFRNEQDYCNTIITVHVLIYIKLQQQ